MSRRGVPVALLLAAGCAPSVTVTDTIETLPLAEPLTPALIVPGVMLPPALPERDAREVLSRAALARAIGARPVAEAASDAALAAEARSRGLPRVVLMTVVQAAPRGMGTEVAIRVRVLEARSGATVGHVTRTRRAGGMMAGRGEGTLAAELEALARDILR